jgi:hypothetical protein
MCDRLGLLQERSALLTPLLDPHERSIGHVGLAHADRSHVRGISA